MACTKYGAYITFMHSDNTNTHTCTQSTISTHVVYPLISMAIEMLKECQSELH